VYCKTLKNGGILTYGVVLLNGNARPHRVVALEHCWSISTGSCLTTLITAPISLRATTTYVKNWLRSQHCNTNEELMEGARTWLNSQATDFFDTGIQKRIPQCDRCLNSCGDYVEK
jgi:hypothetical protein